MICAKEETVRTLLLAYIKLGALEAGGIDDWDWYDSILEEHYPDDIAKLIDENPVAALQLLFKEAEK